MVTSTNHNKTQEINPAKKQERIDAHKEIAAHLENAAKHHREAAKHHEENNTEKSAKSIASAHEYLNKAGEIEKEVSTKDTLSIKK